jgi:hypothetical protein
VALRVKDLREVDPVEMEVVVRATEGGTIPVVARAMDPTEAPVEVRVETRATEALLGAEDLPGAEAPVEARVVPGDMAKDKEVDMEEHLGVSLGVRPEIRDQSLVFWSGKTVEFSSKPRTTIMA